MARFNVAGLLTALAMAAAVFLQAAKAEDHTVGDNTGWTTPTSPNVYRDWAARIDFDVRDRLVFNFPTGAHDVTVVSRQGYDACSTSNAINRITSGPATVTLNTTGMHYFICGFPGHCSTGQKLAVNVTSDDDDDSRPSGSPSAPPSGSGTPPTTPSGSGTPPTTPSGAGTPSRPSPSSAAAPGVAFALVLVSFAVALFC